MYSRISLSQVDSSLLCGVWHQVGSIRPWYEPRPSSVKATIVPRDQGYVADVEVRLGGVTVRPKGTITRRGETQFSLSLPMPVFGVDLNRLFTVKAALRDTSGHAALVMLSKEGSVNVYVFTRSLEPAATLVTEIPALLRELGYDESYYR